MWPSVFSPHAVLRAIVRRLFPRDSVSRRPQCLRSQTLAATSQITILLSSSPPKLAKCCVYPWPLTNDYDKATFFLFDQNCKETANIGIIQETDIVSSNGNIRDFIYSLPTFPECTNLFLTVCVSCRRQKLSIYVSYFTINSVRKVQMWVSCVMPIFAVSLRFNRIDFPGIVVIISKWSWCCTL